MLSVSTVKSGADIIALFRREALGGPVFLVTGGACAFIVDSLFRDSPDIGSLVVVQHEQSAAMAADSIWRASRKVGMTLATSGPGATNLLTGIACSWFDSVPSFHITGQVPSREQSEVLGVPLRQLGFQETDIVSMARPITKYAERVISLQDLVEKLFSALTEAMSGRMGPVLLDVPMDVQQLPVTDEIRAFYSERLREFRSNLPLKGFNAESAEYKMSETRSSSTTWTAIDVDTDVMGQFIEQLTERVKQSVRPVILLGAGASDTGAHEVIIEVLSEWGIPYVSSWAALPYIEKIPGLFQGSIGVYGDRLANYAIQNADLLVSFGSRLDSRQRTSRPSGFAPFAHLMAVDVDRNELEKLEKTAMAGAQIETFAFNLSSLLNLHRANPRLLKEAFEWRGSEWLDALVSARNVYKSDSIAGTGEWDSPNRLSPYTVVPPLLRLCSEMEWQTVADCGANLCWVYRSVGDLKLDLFTAGGHSPMGYSLPAALGPASQGRPTVAFIGDGGLQMCVQELQTVAHNQLPIGIIILNNFGYGIIKQFQDANLEGRHVASGVGYSQPDWSKVADAYGIDYKVVSDPQQLHEVMIWLEVNLARHGKPAIVDLHLDERSPIVPKVEGDLFLHDQWPRIDYSAVKMFQKYPDRPSEL